MSLVFWWTSPPLRHATPRHHNTLTWRDKNESRHKWDGCKKIEQNSSMGKDWVGEGDDDDDEDLYLYGGRQVRVLLARQADKLGMCNVEDVVVFFFLGGGSAAMICYFFNCWLLDAG